MQFPKMLLFAVIVSAYFGTGTNATVYSAPKYAKDSQESKTPKLDITFQAFSDGSTAPEKLQSWIKEAIKDLESKYIYGTGRPHCAYLVKYMMNNYGKYWHCFNFKSDDYNFSFYEEDPYDDHAAFFTYNNHCWIVFRSKSEVSITEYNQLKSDYEKLNETWHENGRNQTCNCSNN